MKDSLDRGKVTDGNLEKRIKKKWSAIKNFSEEGTFCQTSAQLLHGESAVVSLYW